MRVVLATRLLQICSTQWGCEDFRTLRRLLRTLLRAWQLRLRDALAVDGRPVLVAHVEEGPALACRLLRLLLGALRVTVLAHGVVAEHEHAHALVLRVALGEVQHRVVARAVAERQDRPLANLAHDGQGLSVLAALALVERRRKDYVLVEAREKANVGEIVVANVDGEWTLKYLDKDAKGLFLRPANSRYAPIRAREKMTIAGVVRAVVRRYGV